MLEQIFHDPLSLRLSQAVVVALLALAVIWIARWRNIHLERETIVALARGIVQVVAVGSLLLFLFQGPAWTGILVLTGMIIAAAAIAARRAKDIPGAFEVSLYGIGFGAGVVISLMSWLGVIDVALTSLIPVGSMVIAMAMNTSALALDRIRGEVEAHVGQIEAGLALGADPGVTVAPYVQKAVQASLIPRIDSLRSLGIVWIPGLMAGMILAGSDPIDAAIYQFVVIAMIFAVAALTAVACTLLIQSRIFSSAEQLLIRPGKRLGKGARPF